MICDRSTRRLFLRAAGAVVALPLLESMGRRRTATAGEANPRHSLVAMNVSLGLHAENLIPEQAGFDYDPPVYLKLLSRHRDRMTMISGVSHPEVGGGHHSSKSFLTAAPHPSRAGFRNTISLDQLAAEQLGSETRFASLSLSSSGPGLSWSRSGVEIPTQTRPSRIFERLFVVGSPAEKAQQVQRLRDGRSILDLVLQQSLRMEKRLSAKDRDKLAQYFTSVREAEQRLAKAEDWADRSLPKVDVSAPRDETDSKRMIENMRSMFDMAHLALQTDSTRFITYQFTGGNLVPAIAGVDVDYHMLSHHGKDPEKIRQLTIVESEVIQAFDGFLTKLAQTPTEEGRLLDRTMVLFGSNLGNASSHDTRNMPMLLAGGGFRHGQHLAFDRTNNAPLSKLYVSILQRLGIEVDSFGGCGGTLGGLEMI